jgi:hypothetical protein
MTLLDLIFLATSPSSLNSHISAQNEGEPTHVADQQKKRAMTQRASHGPGSVDCVCFLFKLGCRKRLPSPVVAWKRLRSSL